MTGATGYIGKHLSNYLTEKGGHRIILTWLLRNKSPNILSSVKWRKPTAWATVVVSQTVPFEPST